MIVAPIIHTRTFSCDFNSEFLVRPDRFMDSDIKWARKNVLGATGEIDGLQGVRWLIADNEKYRIAGVVGFLKNICSKCRMSESDRLKSEELFCDDKGRLVYAFIGIVIDKAHSDSFGMLTLDYLWSIYLDKVYPIWKRTYQEIVLESFSNVNLETVTNRITEEPISAGSKELFEANAVTDYELFCNLLCNTNKTNFSFCSNIVDFNVVKQSEFSIVTTSRNIITRLKKENVTKPDSDVKESLTATVSSSDSFEQSKESRTKKKRFVTLTIGLTTFAAIILILLLTWKTGSGQNIGR